ncbi:MarR family transcriptional regulator [Streptomyces olivochromogenes]|uniref:MarR family transcriptional regulator n=1 Tax=Streptomyces olivochromogenes TaxID=1963 RepID=A0A250VRA1_STROL|nr:MarR family transcriptional regulator [Streptomyces olivochromogenes]
MTKRGLVTREECPDGGRGAFVVATPAGYAAIEAPPPDVRNTEARLHVHGCS